MYCTDLSPNGSVAQLVERTTENREVTGSMPVGATTDSIQLLQAAMGSHYQNGYFVACWVGQRDWCLVNE